MPTMKCLIHNVLLLSVAKKNKTKKSKFWYQIQYYLFNNSFFFFNEENIALTVIIEKEMEIY